MIETKQLQKRFEDVSKNAQRYILQNIGLKKLSQKVLTMYYVDEMSYADIADSLGYEIRYVNKAMHDARIELNKIVSREFKLMDNELKEYIKLIIDDEASD